MKSIFKHSVVILLLMAVNVLSAQTYHSVSYLKNVQSAILPPEAHVLFISQFHASRLEIVNDQSEPVQIDDNQFNVGVCYSPYRALEFGVKTALLKSNHRTDEHWDSPSHVDVWATWGTRPLCDSSYYMAFGFSSRLPLEIHSNNPLQYYSAQRVNFGLRGLATWIVRRSPCYNLQVDFNSQFLDHNDKGLDLASEQNTIQKSTKEFIYGLSVQNNFKTMSYFVELYGRHFLRRPPVSVYTREDCLYLIPGMFIRPTLWLCLNMSVNILLKGNEDRTDYNSQTDRLWELAPNLPKWRIQAGLGIVLDAGRSRREQDDLRDILGVSATPDTVEQDSLFDRDEFLEQIREDNISEQEFIKAYRELLLRERKEKEAMIRELRERLKEQKETEPENTE